MKKLLRVSALALAVYLICLTFPLFFGCESGEVRFYTAFNGITVTVQSRGKNIGNDLGERIAELLREREREFSATADGAFLRAVNGLEEGEELSVSPLFESVFGKCVTLNGFTRGKFDPSVYPLSVLWQFSPNYPVKNFIPPTAEEISALLPYIGTDGFIIKDGKISKKEGYALDLGGAVKGLVADEIARLVMENGATGGFISVGGSSIRLIAADGTDVTHPRENGNIFTVLFDKNAPCVSTSGDYRKYYSFGGKTYSHIIDPQTGYPSRGGVVSVTVTGKDGLVCDALSTAISLFRHDFANPENGELYGFIRDLKGSEFDCGVIAVCLSEDGKQIVTNLPEKGFTLYDRSYTVISVE